MRYFHIFVANGRHVARTPIANVSRDGGKFRTRAPVDTKTVGKDQKIELEQAALRGHAQTVVDDIHFVDGGAEKETRIVKFRYALNAATWRLFLLQVDVMPNATFSFVRQIEIAVGQPRVAGALALFDAGKVCAAYQQ